MSDSVQQALNSNTDEEDQKVLTEVGKFLFTANAGRRRALTVEQLLEMPNRTEHDLNIDFDPSTVNSPLCKTQLFSVPANTSSLKKKGTYVRTPKKGTYVRTYVRTFVRTYVRTFVRSFVRSHERRTSVDGEQAWTENKRGRRIS